MSSKTENSTSDEEFLKSWAKLVRYVAYAACRSYSLPFEDIEDIEQDINIKLIKLPDERRVQEGYVRVTINNAVRHCIRKSVTRGGGGGDWKDWETIDFETAAPGNDFDAEGSALIDAVIPIPDSPEESLHQKAFIEQAMETLPPELRSAISAHYLEDLTLEQAAVRCKVSRETIRKRIVTALRLLRARLSD